MRSTAKDSIGVKYGKLTVLDLVGKNKHGGALAKCKCECGSLSTVILGGLKSGNTTKCNTHPKNTWIEKDDYFYIDVSTPLHPDKKTKIDKDDFQKVIWGNRTRWLFHDSAPKFDWGNYVIDSNRKNRLHRFLMGDVPPQMIVDHINGDTLDNRKNNLRIITRSENNKNMRKRIDNTSGSTGVYLKDGLWIAEITLKNKKYWLGSFDSVAQANAAYKGAARVLGFSERHGESHAY